VTNANAYDSEARVLSGKPPQSGYAVLRERGVQIGRLGLWIDSSVALDRVRETLGRVPEIQIVTEGKLANLKLMPKSTGMGLYTPDGLPMFDRESPILDAQTLVAELKQWANWFAMQALNNPESNLRVKLRLEPVKGRGPLPGRLPELGSAGMTVDEKSEFEPVVTNDSDETLYMTLLGMSSDRSIGVIFPTTADADAAFEVKKRSERRLPAIRAIIPECLNAARDVLLLFASTEPVGFFPFAQKGFCVGGSRTLVPVTPEATRVIPAPGTWATARLVVEIRR
jgi:hypothetical protein